ncbi:hypothetical protein [Thalassomonas haliotis]|uniref:Uncharacterized protein n=1 Tax=Thalassomonas haliotis TaxID=485448 RepID=A0ABY7V7G2_9GAMM|nr:hypothetical protein [Thalassomonas haliotis]WDE09367.1 hypothetical protein H3N35_13575 [Thalassomonas haliotis]
MLGSASLHILANYYQPLKWALGNLIQTMTFDSIYPTLKRYIEKCNKLEKSRFTESLSKEFKLEINITSGGPLETSCIRPDQDNIDAFVLNFRYFIQNNEPTSIRNLTQFFNSDLVTQEERSNFNLLRSNIKDFLSSSSNLAMFEKNFSHSDLMDVFIYGGISHATKDKAEKFNSIMEREDASEFFWHKFIIILSFMMQAIVYLKNMLIIIIERHKAQFA